MSKLKIAIQKSGRLHDDSMRLLASCGIALENRKGELKVSASNFPLDVLFFRNSDIPQYLEDGVADIAIVGENVLVEKETKATIVQSLGFSKCRLSLAVPREVASNDVDYFEGKKIATSYPNTLRNYLRQKNVNADIHSISGSVEIAPNIGLADGICDLVSSGSTLLKNGLRETQVLLQSQAVLAASATLQKEQQALLERLLFRIQAVQNAQRKKYILLNVPNEKIEAVSTLLPVLKSPTILPLAEEGWSSLHSVIDEDAFWDVIDQLKAAGAQGILIVPIDKMVM